jgi:hypothetical protein
VIETYTARSGKIDLDMDVLHASEVLGTGWLVYPIADPGEWTDEDEQRLVEALARLQATDFRREVDLGRFLGGDEPYFVR